MKPKVSAMTLLSCARNYGELREALGEFINDMLERERDGGEQVTGGDMAVVLGAVYGKMGTLAKDAQTGPHCTNPECTFTNGKGAVFRTRLETIESNVSGCGYDLVRCKSCGREYNVFYEVSKVVRVDPDTGEEIG